MTFSSQLVPFDKEISLFDDLDGDINLISLRVQKLRSAESLLY
jgi:hypothetical protein